MDNIKLFRKRFIPNEIVELKNDIILEMDNEVIITKWNVLNKRTDFNNGFSYYDIKNDTKVSKFFKDTSLIYTYCDIIETIKNENEYIFNDLLVDVILYNDGFLKVVDVAEIAEALENNLITVFQCKKALLALDYLLNEIYTNKFSKYNDKLFKYINSKS